MEVTALLPSRPQSPSRSPFTSSSDPSRSGWRRHSRLPRRCTLQSGGAPLSRRFRTLLSARFESAKTSIIPRTSSARLRDFLTLMKPRVMLLAVFTALVGLMIAPAHLDPILGSIAILAIAAGAGAAGVLNMWYDADIDAVMTRTAMRSIPRGTVSRAEALAFGLVLAGSAVALLGFALNVKAAALLG